MQGRCRAMFRGRAACFVCHKTYLVQIAEGRSRSLVARWLGEELACMPGRLLPWMTHRNKAAEGLALALCNTAHRYKLVGLKIVGLPSSIYAH